MLLNTADLHYPSLNQALRYWFKLGFISFGGPAGQIAMLHQEMVEKHRWISERRFLHALNYCMLLPGPEAMQLVVYIGWLLHGVWGGLLAGLSFIVPGFLILCSLAALYLAWGDVPAVQAVFHGIKPAVVAIVCYAAWRIGQRTLKQAWLWGIALASFIALTVFKISFGWIVLAAGSIGLLVYKLKPGLFKHDGHNEAQAAHTEALIGDDTPSPAYAQFKLKRLLLTLAGFLTLWLVSLGLLLAASPLLSNMGLFFTKTAFLTIGGAYAVLPYVYHGAVEHYQWLSAVQMMDGLALGETTPGPLIMIVTWIGYLGGVSQQVAANSLVAGLIGASVTTFYTFLPSFLFIFAGAPLVEATRFTPQFTAPLTAITAAVVGVIANLALFFAWHTFWFDSNTQPTHQIDVFAIVMAICAFIALWKYQVDVLKVIVVCAFVGLITFWL